MLVIRDTSSVPGERWQYRIEGKNYAVVGAKDYTVYASSYGLLYPEVKKHCEENGVMVPSEQEVVDWVCRELHVNCYEGRVAFVNKLTMGLPLPATSCCGK